MYSMLRWGCIPFRNFKSKLPLECKSTVINLTLNAFCHCLFILSMKTADFVSLIVNHLVAMVHRNQWVCSRVFPPVKSRLCLQWSLLRGNGIDHLSNPALVSKLHLNMSFYTLTQRNLNFPPGFHRGITTSHPSVRHGRLQGIPELNIAYCKWKKKTSLIRG